MKKIILTAFAFVFACTALFAQNITPEQKVINAWNNYNKAKGSYIDNPRDEYIIKKVESIEQTAQNIYYKMESHSFYGLNHQKKKDFKIPNWGNDAWGRSWLGYNESASTSKTIMAMTRGMNKTCSFTWKEGGFIAVLGTVLRLANLFTVPVDICANAVRISFYIINDACYLGVMAFDENRILCNSADKAMDKCKDIGEACKNIDCKELTAEEKRQLYRVLSEISAGLNIIEAQLDLEGRAYAVKAKDDIKKLLEGKDLDKSIYNKVSLKIKLEGMKKDLPQKSKQLNNMQDIINNLKK